MATGTVYLDERDIETDFGVIVEEVTGFPGGVCGAPRDVPLAEAPELSGGLADPRLFRRKKLDSPTIKGHIKQATMAAALPYLDNLRALLGQGEVRVRTAYAPDRYCLALCEATDGGPSNANVLDGQVNVILKFVVSEGVARRLNPDGYALTTGRTAVPIGTAAVAPVLLVHGGGATLTNPTVTVRNAAGDVVQTMGFTVSLGANDALRIDTARCFVSKISAGVITDGISLWTSGDFPLLRPYDGWVENAVYPTVELSASAGTAQGEITYTRRYL